MSVKSKKKRISKKAGQKGSSFVTDVADSKESNEKDVTNKKAAVAASQKHCVYCHNKHMIAECSKIKQLPHEERIDFLKLSSLMPLKVP